MNNLRWENVIGQSRTSWGDRWAGSVWALVGGGPLLAIVQEKESKYVVNVYVPKCVDPRTLEFWRIDGPFDTIEEAKAYAQAIVVLEGMT